MQAQVPAAAEQALAIRTANLKAGAVTAALEQERTLVRTWAMRGTLHLLRTDDLPLYCAAVGPAGVKELHRWLGTARGLSPEQIAQVSAAIVDALSAGPLTRQELADRVVEQLGDSARAWVEHSWGGIVKQAAFEGAVCYGPDRGREVTFARVDTWLGRALILPDGQAARRELLRRYLASYGPATSQDFMRWSGLHASDARQALADLRDELSTVDVAGRELLVRQSDVTELCETGAEDVVRLLPTFDPFMLGHADKSHLVDEAFYKQVYRKAGWVSSVVLQGGRVVGVWESERKPQTLNITVALFAAAAIATQALQEAAAPYGVLYALPVTVASGTPLNG